ncbi:MAG: hypothetical protein KUG82_23035 [Pseudomonadales bacterium]|nr:hypothetical protein [Pseudomonadales bacterium]
MIKKRKGPDCARSEPLNSSLNQDFNAIRSFIKTVIVRLASRGLIPSGLAAWLVQHGGLKHA